MVPIPQVAISEIDDSVPIPIPISIPIPIPIPIPISIPIPIPIPIHFNMAWLGRAAHGALPSGNLMIKLT